MGIRIWDAFRHSRRRKAFTLVEVVISAGIIAVFVTGSLATIIRLNRLAMLAKLHTAALALTQQQIDSALTAPWLFNGEVPSVLAASRDEPPAEETDPKKLLPLNDDPSVKGTGTGSPFSDLDLNVGARRHTEIANLGPRTKVVTVTVKYTYLGKEYQVELSTIRACDSN